MPGKGEGGNGGLDEMKTCYHECNKFGRYLRNAKVQLVTLLLPLITLR